MQSNQEKVTSENDIIGLLERGWLGWLALGYIVIDKTGLLNKIVGLFVTERESKQKAEDNFQALAFRSVEKSVDEIPVRLDSMEREIKNAKELLLALIEATRSINAESGVVESKVSILVNQFADITSKLGIILDELRTCSKKET